MNRTDRYSSEWYRGHREKYVGLRSGAQLRQSMRIIMYNSINKLRMSETKELAHWIRYQIEKPQCIRGGGNEQEEIDPDP